MNIREVYSNIRFCDYDDNYFNHNSILTVNHTISKLSDNSKECCKDCIFYAIKGEKNNGENYIEEAIYNGAKTIVTENNKIFIHHKINYIFVDNVRKQLAIDAKKFYHDITSKMKIIGVTGTNGKTTITSLVYKYLRHIGEKCALIGSNGVFLNDEYFETSNTTPSILSLYDFFLKAYKKNIRIVSMEVSSHAIKMLRVSGINFFTILFTNITLDHLDYHKNFSDYLNTKALLVARQSKNVILNHDINEYHFLNSITNSNVYTFGKEKLSTVKCDFSFSNEEFFIDKTFFDLEYLGEKYHIETNMLANFNVYNVVSFIAIIKTLGLFNKNNAKNVIDFLKQKIKIDGRMDVININNKTIVIDFAHTPDGVKNVLEFLISLNKCNIITVLGCGGNRDKEKRPIMGHIATDLSDYVIFTSDSPRDEDPNQIIEEMIKNVERKNYSVVVDRKEAIDIAIDIMKEDDVLAILGKGNEKYITINNEKIPFKDSEEVIQHLLNQSNRG